MNQGITELPELSESHGLSIPLPLTIIPPPPTASSSTASNRCNSPSCLALFHRHQCLHSQNRSASPDHLCSKDKHEEVPPLPPSLFRSISGTFSQHSLHQHNSCSDRSHVIGTSRADRTLITRASSHSISCSNADMSGHTLVSHELNDTRLSRSVEDLPLDIQEHILKCKCPCDHMGYGNMSVSGIMYDCISFSGLF